VTIRIKYATTAEEFDGAFLARHRVFVAEEHAFAPNGDRRILDRFDAFPTTRIVVALAPERVVGSVRFTEDSLSGTPPGEYYDFSEQLPAGAGLIGSGSMLCVERAYRRSGLAFYLLGLGYAWALARNWSHVVGVSNPDTQDVFLKSGYRAIAAPTYSAYKGVPFVPVILDMHDLDVRYRQFAQALCDDEFYLSYPVLSNNPVH
jgi:N-acyl-L-homoserine lactone synthetase